VAEQDGYVVGAVAIDLAGSIPLLVVQPNWQRRRIGTTLLELATSQLWAAGVRQAHLGSGGQGYIWPGVPANVPAAARFFESRGWMWDHRVSDLTADLRGYVAPDGVHERLAAAGVRLAVVEPGNLAEAPAFERRHRAATEVGGGCGLWERRGRPRAVPEPGFLCRTLRESHNAAVAPSTFLCTLSSRSSRTGGV